MSKAISKKQNYVAPVESIRGLEIFGYDMVSAGLSVLRRTDALPEAILDELASLPKKERVIRLGLMMRDDKKLLMTQENGIQLAVREFCQANDIQSSDIVSIKRDAVYATRAATKLSFGHVVWQRAGRFSSWYKLGGIEFYHDSHGSKLEVKGLGSDVTELHRPHFLEELKSVIIASETLPRDRLAEVCIRARRRYVRFQLDPECYREMNSGSTFRLKNSVGSFDIFSETFPGFDDLDVSYNYSVFLAKLFRCLLG